MRASFIVSAHLQAMMPSAGDMITMIADEDIADAVALAEEKAVVNIFLFPDE